MKHTSKHTPKHCSSTQQSTDSIDKPINLEPINLELGKAKRLSTAHHFEVIDYFKEKGFDEHLEKAFEYYNIGKWKDSKGNQVKIGNRRCFQFG